MAEPDICIVGGGPAGLAAAIAFRRAGLNVTLLDVSLPAIDKACGEGLLPDTLHALAELGVEVPQEQGYALRGIRFVSGGCSVQADFPQGSAIGLRRTVLHGLLMRRAADLGVDLQWGSTPVQLHGSEVTASGTVFRPKLIVGADGLNSKIRKAASLDKALTERRRYGFRRHFAVRPWARSVEVYWARHCQIYVTPISAREVGVAVLTNNPSLRVRQAVAAFPELTARLRGAVPTSQERGALTVQRRLKSVCRGNVALVGDASGSVDAITGEGINLSIRQALALACCFGNGRLYEYQKAHTRLRQRPACMAELLLCLARFERVQRSAVNLLGRWPSLFEKLLAFHVGSGGSGLLNTAASDAADRHADNVVDRNRFLDDERLPILGADQITVKASDCS